MINPLMSPWFRSEARYEYDFDFGKEVTVDLSSFRPVIQSIGNGSCNLSIFSSGFLLF
jgi:hypothetical protein